MPDTYVDRFGQEVAEGDVVIWSPSGQSWLQLRRITSITYKPGDLLKVRPIVMACRLDETNPSRAARAINHHVTALYHAPELRIT
jgi:hypothetical protein